jgi:predicted metal-dependent hydrolase
MRDIACDTLRVNPAPLRCAVHHDGRRIEYTLVRSARRRRTITITVGDADNVVVRAPLRTTRSAVDDVVRRKSAWILRRRHAESHRRARKPQFSDTERAAFVERAREAIDTAVRRWAPVVGRRPSRALVRNQKRLWGSCSRDGTLRFNWRLVLLDRSLLEYVVVHELAHLRVRNHQREFWSVVEAALPDFKERRARLRESGEILAV